jgi:hypothetical protein
MPVDRQLLTEANTMISSADRNLEKRIDHADSDKRIGAFL